MKRFLITISIILASALLFFVGLFVILVLAPGSRIFGIEYVSAQVGVADISQEWAEYIDGDIYLNTKDVPVTINFEPYGRTKVEFVQHYSGYTTGGFRVPDAQIIKDANGITVNTNEIQRFLFGTNHEYGLVITLPLSWGTSGRHSIYVVGENSKTTINANADATLEFVELSLKGKGEIALNCNFDIRTFSFYTPKKLNLESNHYAQNVSVETTSADVNLNYALSGNIEASMGAGDLGFVSCNNANITTSSGKVFGLNDGGIVYGNVNIKSLGGDIELLSLNGVSDENQISSTSGDITIGTLTRGYVKSERGDILISSLITATIENDRGKTNVGAVSGSVNVSSQSGKVCVGSFVDGVARNVTVSTTSGDCVLKNTVGAVKVTSSSGEVELFNTTSTNVEISSGNKIFATGLLGGAKISSNANITLHFSRIVSENVITGNQKCRNINISVENLTPSQFSYSLKTTADNEGMASIYSGSTCLAQDLVLEANNGSGKLTVSGTGCRINIYTPAQN